MPLPFLLTSSDGFTGGGARTRFSAPVLSGIWTPSTAAPANSVDRSTPGAVALVQHGTVVSTLGARTQIVSTAAAAVSAASYVYIPQTTGAIATSSFAAGASAPPYSGMGAALVWDSGTERLGIFSTVANGWLWIGGSTSTGIAGTFTSQSS